MYSNNSTNSTNIYEGIFDDMIFEPFWLSLAKIPILLYVNLLFNLILINKCHCAKTICCNICKFCNDQGLINNNYSNLEENNIPKTADWFVLQEIRNLIFKPNYNFIRLNFAIYLFQYIYILYYTFFTKYEYPLMYMLIRLSNTGMYNIYPLFHMDYIMDNNSTVFKFPYLLIVICMMLLFYVLSLAPILMYILQSLAIALVSLFYSLLVLLPVLCVLLYYECTLSSHCSVKKLINLYLFEAVVVLAIMPMSQFAGIYNGLSDCSYWNVIKCDYEMRSTDYVMYFGSKSGINYPIWFWLLSYL